MLARLISEVFFVIIVVSFFPHFVKKLLNNMCKYLKNLCAKKAYIVIIK